MQLKTKLLYLAAFFIFTLPLVLTRNAMATYVGDGATHDSSTTGWKIPPIGAEGCKADGTKTSKPDCETVRYPSYTTSAACSAGQEFTDGTSIWMSACTDGGGNAINMKDGDRNALQCDAKGGTYAGACVGKWYDALDTEGGTTYQCLRCHNSTYQRNSYKARWKDTYLKTGHKNMLRKVSSGAPWAGPDGVVYAADSGGNHIDWTNATVTRTNLTPNVRALYYIYGDWMAPAVSTVFDNSAAGDGTSAKYSCGGCHTTGFETTNFVTTKKPYTDYPGITSQITGSWDQSGIVCSRCHNSTIDGTAHVETYRNSAAVNTGASMTFASHHGGDQTDAQVTAICFECHNSTQTNNDPAGQLKTAASGAGFSGHILGNQFLNSPHAQFTGTRTQIGTDDNYASHFAGGSCKIIKAGITSSSGQGVEANSASACANLVTTYGADSYSWTPTSQGNCTTCHDVHQSIVPEVGAEEPLKRECTTCHRKKIYNMNHPTGGETPAGLAGANASIACEICHMATMSPEGSTHLPPHLWRINTSASYRTFPTSAEWSAGTKIANTAPDGDYANAVWVDLDLACGQCHGGSAGPSATQYDAPYISKLSLSAYAKNMHNNAAPKASFTSNVSLYTVTLTDTSTDDSIFPDNAIKVNWGDGTSSTGDAGSVFEHTYATAARFNIVYTVKDSDGLKSSKTKTVAVKFSITANISPALSTNAKFILKKNGIIIRTGTGTDSYVFSGLRPGTYKVKVKKLDYTFDGDDVTDGNQNPITVIVGTSDETVTFTHTP